MMMVMPVSVSWIQAEVLQVLFDVTVNIVFIQQRLSQVTRGGFQHVFDSIKLLDFVFLHVFYNTFNVADDLVLDLVDEFLVQDWVQLVSKDWSTQSSLSVDLRILDREGLVSSYMTLSSAMPVSFHDDISLFLDLHFEFRD